MYKYSKEPLSFDDMTSFNTLLKAHKIARLSKRHKNNVINFEMDLFYNLTNLEKELKSQTYKVGEYNTFYIYEPKKREIQALDYVDRIVQHTICDNYLTPFYKKRLILCNCACQEGKGTSFAIKKLKEFFVSYYKKYSNQGYILKCDIKKYFANIDHKILKEQLQDIQDIKVRDLIYNIIDSYNYDTQKGLPIGNQVSQVLGVVYLNKLDHYIKEQLKIKYYLRYMDDLILIHYSKEYLTECLAEMKLFLDSIKLEFNAKTQVIPIKNGVEFLGGRFYLSKTGKVIAKLKKQSRQRFKRNIKKIKKLYDSQKIGKDYIQAVCAGYNGHLSKFNAYKVLYPLIKFYKTI